MGQVPFDELHLAVIVVVCPPATSELRSQLMIFRARTMVAVAALVGGVMLRQALSGADTERDKSDRVELRDLPRHDQPVPVLHGVRLDDGHFGAASR